MYESRIQRIKVISASVKAEPATPAVVRVIGPDSRSDHPHLNAQA